MTVSAAPLQKEIYSHNPMMKGMTNYFPCIGTQSLSRAQAGGRKRKRHAAGKDKEVFVCIHTHTQTETFHPATTTCHSLPKLPNAELLMI